MCFVVRLCFVSDSTAVELQSRAWADTVESAQIYVSGVSTV